MTMFLITAGEAWLPDLPAFSESGQMNAGVVVFCVSFIVIVNWTLLQVSVAILLDNFVTATSMEEKGAAQDLIASHRTRTELNSLDPLLCFFADHFDTNCDLSTRILHLYQVLDVDQNGTLDFQEIMIGLRKIECSPRINLSLEDLEKYTADAGLDPKHGVLSLKDFEAVMRNQLKEYAQRSITDAMLSSDDNTTSASLASFKMLLIMTETLHGQAISRVDKVQAVVMSELSGLHAKLDMLLGHGGCRGTTPPSAPHDPQARQTPSKTHVQCAHLEHPPQANAAPRPLGTRPDSRPTRAPSTPPPAASECSNHPLPKHSAALRHSALRKTTEGSVGRQVVFASGAGEGWCDSGVSMRVEEREVSFSAERGARRRTPPALLDVHDPSDALSLEADLVFLQLEESANANPLTRTHDHTRPGGCTDAPDRGPAVATGVGFQSIVFNGTPSSYGNVSSFSPNFGLSNFSNCSSGCGNASHCSPNFGVSHLSQCSSSCGNVSHFSPYFGNRSNCSSSCGNLSKNSPGYANLSTCSSSHGSPGTPGSDQTTPLDLVQSPVLRVVREESTADLAPRPSIVHTQICSPLDSGIRGADRGWASKLGVA